MRTDMIRTATLLLNIQSAGLAAMLDTLHQAEQRLREHGETHLADEIYAMGCELGSNSTA